MGMSSLSRSALDLFCVVALGGVRTPEHSISRSNGGVLSAMREASKLRFDSCVAAISAALSLAAISADRILCIVARECLL